MSEDRMTHGGRFTGTLPAAMRRAGWLTAILVLSGCTAQVQSTPAAPATTAPQPPSMSASASAVTTDQGGTGPGGMTLRQEVGAVMMVGFTGPLTPAVLDDWRQRQFGGVLLLPAYQNAADGAVLRNTIGSLRGVMTHPLLAATDVEGGAACFTGIGVPCSAGAQQAASRGTGAVQSAMAAMSGGLKALGFDIDLAPEADVGRGPDASAGELMYGTDTNAVAQAVRAAIAGIHAAGMYAVAKHFQNRDLPPFTAAIAAHVDMVMVGDLEAPAAVGDPTSNWPALLHSLRFDLRFQGPAISDDLQAPAAQAGYSAASAGVRFLAAGGDMVMVSHDLGVADTVYDAIYAAVEDGSYPRAQLDASVQKLLNLRLRYMP